MTLETKTDAISDRMAHIAGGNFIMGSDQYYREEAPARECSVESFRLDVCAVSNNEFAKFISATNYVTTAEKIPDRTNYPEMPEEFFSAGSLVFVMPDKPVPLDDTRNWWQFVEGACWRHPEGPDSHINGRGNHPVVHVSHSDAFEFAHWAGKSLPTEAEWEYAAAAGSQKDHSIEDTKINIWSGLFPHHNTKVTNPPFTLPVDAFQPNQNGVFNMIGNVWEWTADLYDNNEGAVSSCCSDLNHMNRPVSRVIKGGSFLCAPNYCRRYRPSARLPYEELSSASHIGFRCVHPQ